MLLFEQLISGFKQQGERDDLLKRHYHGVSNEFYVVEGFFSCQQSVKYDMPNDTTGKRNSVVTVISSNISLVKLREVQDLWSWRPGRRQEKDGIRNFKAGIEA